MESSICAQSKFTFVVTLRRRSGDPRLGSVTREVRPVFHYHTGHVVRTMGSLLKPRSTQNEGRRTWVSYQTSPRLLDPTFTSVTDRSPSPRCPRLVLSQTSEVFISTKMGCGWTVEQSFCCCCLLFSRNRGLQSYRYRLSPKNPPSISPESDWVLYTPGPRCPRPQPPPKEYQIVLDSGRIDPNSTKYPVSVYGTRGSSVSNPGLPRTGPRPHRGELTTLRGFLRNQCRSQLH